MPERHSLRKISVPSGSMWRIALVTVVLQSVWCGPVKPCERLEAIIVSEINTITRELVFEGAQLLQRVIENAEELSPSETDRHALEKFSIFVKSTKQADGSEELQDLLEELAELIDLNEVSLELDASEELVSKLLRQHGFDTFERNLDKTINNAIKRIEYHIETYLRRLKGFDGRNSEMPAWFRRFQDEVDIENKFLMLTEILDDIDC